MNFREDILNAVNEPVSFVGKDYCYIYVNQAYGRYYNCNPEQIIGKPVSHFLGEVHFHQNIKPHFDRCLQGEEVEYENITPFKNGPGDRFMLMHYYPHYNKNGEIDGIISTATDKTEEYLLTQNWNNATDALNDLVCMVDKDYNITDINQYGLTLLNKQKKDVIGKKCYEVIHHAKEPLPFCPLKECMQTGTTAKTEIFEERLGKYLSIKISPIFDKNGNLVRFVDVMHDITGLKQNESKLKELNEEYVSVNEELNEQYRKASELIEELEEAQKELNLTLEVTTDGIWKWNFRENDLYFSSNYYRMLGYKPFEFEPTFENWAALVHPDDREKAIATAEAWLEKKEGVYKNSFRCQSKNGQYHYLLATGKVVERDKDGNAARMIGNHIDITERMKAQKELKHNEKKLKEIFNSTSEAIVIHDTKTGKVTECNDSTLTMYGYDSKEEISQLSVKDLSSDKKVFDQTQIEEHINKAVHNENHSFEWLAKKKNGNEFWVDVSLKKTTIAGKMRILAVIRDITERKISEQVLKESEEKFRTYVENANDMIYQLSPEGVFTYVSPNWSELLGYKTDEVIGEKIEKFAHPDDLHLCVDFLNKGLSTGKKQSGVEYRVKHKNGTWRWHESNGAPMKDKNGKIVSYIGVGRDITGRKKQEKATAELSQRYQTIGNNFPNGAVFLFNKNYEYLHVAGKGLHKIGLVGRKLEGKKIQEVFPQDVHETIMKHVPLIFQGKTCYYEIEFEGNIYANWGVPILGNEDKIEEGIVYSIDISELRSNERKLKEAEQIGRIGHVDWDVLNEKASWSDEIFRIYERNPDNGIPGYEEIMRLHVPRDAKKLEQAVLECIQNGTPYELDLESSLKSGRTKYLHIIGNPVKNESGHVVHIRGTVQDITERVKAENNLKAREKLFNNVLNTIPDMVSIHDSNYNIMYSNWNGFGNVESGSRKTNTKCYATYRNNTGICPDCEAKNVLKTKKPHHSEVKLPGGSWVDLRIIPLIDERGECNSFVEWVRDISAIKKSQELLKKNNEELVFAKEKAEEADRLKTEFLNNMSHEVRTPMNGIMGFAQMLKKFNLSEEKKTTYIKLIQENSQQLLKIVDDIIEISALETKQKPLIKDTIDIEAFMQDIRKRYHERAKSKHLSLIVKNHAGHRGNSIITDAYKLRRILNNLIDNAMKFTPHGSITINSSIEKNELKLRVIDTGIGIARENQQVIFQRFAKIDDNIVRKNSGLGLGLSIAKENAQLLGGDIRVKSQPGKGSTFCINIPYEQVEKNQNAEKQATSWDKTKGRATTLLLVEDDEGNYEYFHELFEEYSGGQHNLLHARNGVEAIDLCNKNPDIQVVLMDLKMPVMDGFEATKAIKKKKPGLPVIAQSAFASDEEKHMAARAGCNEYITKPIEIDRLFEVINKFMPGKKKEN